MPFTPSHTRKLIKIISWFITVFWKSERTIGYDWRRRRNLEIWYTFLPNLRAFDTLSLIFSNESKTFSLTFRVKVTKIPYLQGKSTFPRFHQGKGFWNLLPLKVKKTLLRTDSRISDPSWNLALCVSRNNQLQSHDPRIDPRKKRFGMEGDYAYHARKITR